MPSLEDRVPLGSAPLRAPARVVEVVAAAADERAFINGRWQFDDDKLNTLHHLGGGTFVTSGKQMSVNDK